jgi:hypothetical protein
VRASGFIGHAYEPVASMRRVCAISSRGRLRTHLPKRTRAISSAATGLPRVTTPSHCRMQRVRFVVGPQFGEAGDFADQMPPRLRQIVYCGVTCSELRKLSAQHKWESTASCDDSQFPAAAFVRARKALYGLQPTGVIATHNWRIIGIGVRREDRRGVGGESPL